MKCKHRKLMLYNVRHCHLYFRLIIYICNIRTMIREVRKGKKIRENNFPCFTIGCKYGTIWGLGHSYQCHKIIQYNEELHDSIKAALCSTRKSIALSTNVKEKLYWGSCAEDYAASHVLKQYQKQYPKQEQELR